MGWLANVLTSSNAIPIIIIAVLLIVIIAILAKKGIVSFNAFGLKIDNGDDERDVRRSGDGDYVSGAVSSTKGAMANIRLTNGDIETRPVNYTIKIWKRTA